MLALNCQCLFSPAPDLRFSSHVFLPSTDEGHSVVLEEMMLTKSEPAAAKYCEAVAEPGKYYIAPLILLVTHFLNGIFSAFYFFKSIRWNRESIALPSC